jgi:hypothetical protein
MVWKTPSELCEDRWLAYSGSSPSWLTWLFHPSLQVEFQRPSILIKYGSLGYNRRKRDGYLIVEVSIVLLRVSFSSNVDEINDHTFLECLLVRLRGSRENSAPPPGLRLTRYELLDPEVNQQAGICISKRVTY